ncbi:zinc finger protein [Chaetomidium leptoderma]|uniref:Zinc finger protein n=1 Tax=Chaetomidium leptoderma TaxID=669021 RepID=A0AAN6VIR4_9PEZI|nr:zinc finger protein [Chaetomidium leptoderma]
MYALTLKAELEGVTNLRPKDTQEQYFFYTFKVQCTSCRETHPNPIAVSRFEINEMSGSRGEANFVWRCKNCKRESSATIKDAPIPYQQTEPAKPQKILEFDCRGLEFTEFIPEGEWLVDGLESTTKFEGVELTEGEWFDYDEKAGEEPTATLQFLTDAGHLLATTAPETSAYLMNRRSDLMFEHEMPLSDKQRQHVCSCCGSIMLLGKGSHLQVKAEKRASKNSRSSRGPKTRRKLSSGPTKVIACGRCGSRTEVKLPTPNPILRRRLKMSELFNPIGEKVEKVAPAAVVDGTNGNDDEKVVNEIESLCMNCEENGMTRILLTKIPFFREIIIMSFSCDKCGFHNNEVQPAGTFQLKGAHYELRLTAMPDFERQIVKSDTATIKFIELDLEVPAGKGQLTNVEGLLTTVIDDLAFSQDTRKEQTPELYAKIEEVIAKGRKMLAGEAFPFRLSVDDPAGNSFIAPDMRDSVGKWEKREFLRTPEQNAALGLTDTAPTADLDDQGNLVPDQIYQFPASCPGCMHPCTTNMKMVDIPHFRQVVIMNTSCDDCGYKSNDVKTGGEVPEKGRKVTLRVKTPEDLARDILKSESCALECPELNLSVNPGTLGGRFTTVEGLLTQVRDDLHNQIFEADADEEATARKNDSLSTSEKTRWDEFFTNLNAAVKGEKEFTIVLTDPLASSYVQSLADDPTQPDEQMTIVEYDRTDEEEEELGLKDMKTEGYENDAETTEKTEKSA